MKNSNLDNSLKINWFPGHMKKATDELISIAKNVDLIIEVIDARAIESSSNQEITKIFQQKPILKIALKTDYSIVNNSNSDEILFVSLKEKKFKNLIIKKIYEIFDKKIQKDKTKGLVVPKYTILVVGLPNIGKSSLINYLKNKNILKVQNYPGVTKKQQLVSINKNFDIIDTPGILFKKIDDINIGYKLVLINCIKKEVVTLDHVLRFGFNHFYKNHFNSLLNYYKLQDIKNYDDFVQQVCLSKKWITKDNVFDINRFESQIFNDFSLGKITKTNFD